MKFVDYDNDGWPDILQVNGAMLDNIHLYHSEVSYKEPLFMFRNLGKGQFEKASESLGPDFMRPIAGVASRPLTSTTTATSISPSTTAATTRRFCATTAEMPITGWKSC